MMKTHSQSECKYFIHIRYTLALSLFLSLSTIARHANNNNHH